MARIGKEHSILPELLCGRVNTYRVYNSCSKTCKCTPSKMDSELKRLVCHFKSTCFHHWTWMFDDPYVPRVSQFPEKLLVCRLVGTIIKANLSRVPNIPHYQHDLYVISLRFTVSLVLYHVCTFDVQFHILYDCCLFHPCNDRGTTHESHIKQAYHGERDKGQEKNRALLFR